MSVSQELSLNEAAGHFLASLPPEARIASQQEVYNFVRWFGWERPLAGLTPPEVAKYAERLSLSDPNYLKKFELVRAFFVYGRKQGWCRSNLATHVKTKLGKTRLTGVKKLDVPQGIPLTRQGYAELEAELAALKEKRSQVVEDIRRAAADKDFRENAPLAAAREECGRIEGRIMELEELRKSATIIEEKSKSDVRASIGDNVILREADSGEELRYKIVSPREVDPSRGRISSASPLGQAILGRIEGETIEVHAPVGKISYEVRKIER